MLSQAEIDALLNGTSLEEEPSSDQTTTEIKPPAELMFNHQEKDALGEIGNISMGTSATTLYALLGQKVSITTPRVEETTWEEFSQKFEKPYIAIKVQYTEGLMGYNLLILKEEDAKIITDLMMGGDGYGNADADLNDLHLSAISEAMNQMVGSACTSLSSMFEKRVDISPPESSRISTTTDLESIRIDKDSNIIAILFKLTVGNLIDSEIMQLLPLDFAKDLVNNLLAHEKSDQPLATPPTMDTPVAQPMPGPPADAGNAPPAMPGQPQYQMPPQHQMPQHQMPQFQPPPRAEHNHPVNVQPVQFQTFDETFLEFEQKNIGLLMDVPLQITVELGRTTKKIREILEFGQGSIIELDKLAGEPVNILVNGKSIAKGEVVVIDESFGVRITDIIHPSKRL